MKKSLLFASALSLVMLAGCTKEQPTGNGQGSESKLDISGSIVTPVTKMQIGEPADGVAPALWENGDEVLIFAANSQGMIPATSYDWGTNPPTTTQYGGTATATTTSPSAFTYFSCDKFNADLSDDTYTLWGVYSSEVRFSASRETAVSDFCTLPDFSSQTYGESVPYLMVASTPLEAGQEAANLEFTNTSAIMMLNLKGSAAINRVTIKQLNVVSNQSTAVLAYGNYPSINVTKAPKAGSDSKAFADFIVTAENLPQPTAHSEISVSAKVQLTEEGISIPVGVVPFELTADDAIIVTVYGTSDTFEEKSISCTFLPGPSAITSNSIVYLNLAPFSAEDFGQMPPKDDWKAGDVVMSDDFSWITTTVDWSGSQTGDGGGTDIGGGSMSYTDLGGWSNSYSNNGFPYYNLLDSYQGGAPSLLAKRGYTTSGYSYCLWYENNGMLSNVDEYGGAGPLGYSLAALNNYTGNVTVTFKASRVTEANGGDNYGMMPSQFPVSITGNGTIDGNTSVTLGSADYAPFTFYEYTLVIENADASTQITFGSMTAGMYLDDLKITISNDGDTNNLTGTKVEKPATELKYSEPATGTTVDLPATGATTQTFIFKVNGPWKAKWSDNVGLTSGEIDGTNKWIQLGGASWTWMTTREDLYGNETPTAFQLKSIKDNTTGAERTATIEIVSPDEATTYATFNFKQAAQ